MYCMECGAEIEVEAKFCNKCGTKQSIENPIEHTISTETSTIHAEPEKHQGLWQKYQDWLKKQKSDPVKAANFQIKNSLVGYTAICLALPYASVQLTLFGAGKISKAYSVEEPIFFIMAIFIIGGWILLGKRQHYYNVGVFAMLTILAIIRMVAAYSAEAGFGTTITVNHASVLLPILFSISGAFWSLKAKKLEESK